MSAALDWARRRTYLHERFPLERLLERRDGRSVSLCLPAREEAATIGAIVSELMPLRERGLVDQIVVVDAASADGTAELAALAGAEVHDESALIPEAGPIRGKGDAMWRSLTVLSGDIVCFLDADSGGFGEHYVRGLLGPLLLEPEVQFVKGTYRRPFTADGVSIPDGGGRVTELTARPLLNLFYPHLAGFRQPLAGEMAAHRSLFERIPFACGYAVEIALLIDVEEAVGLSAMAQADLGVRENRHQPLSELGPMASAVLRAVARRLEREGRLREAQLAEPLLVPARAGLERRPFSLVERPPLASYRNGEASAEVWHADMPGLTPA